MGQILRAHPALPASRQIVTLGEDRYTLRLRWRERLGAWYADLYDASGVAIWEGQRVTTQWALGLGLAAEGAPDGMLFVRGPADYARADLGGSVELVFYATDELPAPSATASELTITLS